MAGRVRAVAPLVTDIYKMNMRVFGPKLAIRYSFNQPAVSKWIKL